MPQCHIEITIQIIIILIIIMIMDEYDLKWYYSKD